MKLCLRCNQYFEDVLANCPADNTELEAVGDNPLIGALINDRYVVDTVIGKGSSGIVYKATRLLMQREVAVKVLHSYLGAETGSLDRFLREARAASRLKHPHIINIWESGVTDDGQPYFVMDYLEGSTLAELVKDKGALPLQRCLPIVRQICEALGEAHRQSIVHRDVKPENIVLQESDYAQGEDFVKVLDFGIADQATGDQPGSPRQRTAAGSPAYMSPEQCQGFPLDLRSDIYSLAIVVFELLTGTRPFEAEDIMTLFRLHVKQPPPSLSQVRPDLKFPVKLEMAINKALSKDPAKRQQDVLAFCKDVEEAVEGFLLETLNNEYNTPGTDRSGHISTLVLNADVEEAVALPGEKLTSYSDDALSFNNSWNMPSSESQQDVVPLVVPGMSDPFTAPSASGFSIPSQPQSPSVRPMETEVPEIDEYAAHDTHSLLNQNESLTAPPVEDLRQEIDADSASKLLQSAKRASQTFKTNLSNSGTEDVSDWARQILQRKSSSKGTTAAEPAGNGGYSPETPDNTSLSPAAAVDIEAGGVSASAPKITPVPPLPVEDGEADETDSPHVSAWAKQILKRKPDATGAAPTPQKNRTSSTLHRVASSGTPAASNTTGNGAASIVSESSTVDVEELTPDQDHSESPHALASNTSPTRTLLEGEQVFSDSLTASDEPGNGSHDKTLGSLRPDSAARASGIHNKMSIQDAIDAQRKETGKFNSKDIEAWGAIVEAKKANEAAQKAADGGSVLHKLASTSSSAARARATQSGQPSITDKDANDVENPGTSSDKRRFEDPVGDKVESSTKFAKEVDKVLDAAISKGNEQANPSTSIPGNKSGAPFDASRFEQPINKKAEVLNPFAREVEKVIDSAISKGAGGPRRAGDETGMMKSFGPGSEAGISNSGAKPLIRKEGKAGGSSSGPDLKKLLGRRKVDASSPNLLDRAQEALKSSDADAEGSRDAAQQALSEQDELAASALAESISSYEQTVLAATEAAAQQQQLDTAGGDAPDAANGVSLQAYSRSDLDKISFGRAPQPPAEAPPEAAPAEPVAKTPIKLDKMRGVDAARQSQPGFGEKLKSIFGGRKTQNSMANMPTVDPTLDAGKLGKDKGTKSGIAALENEKDKNKNTKSGMIPAEKDKGTKSGLAPAVKDKGTKSGMSPADKNADKNTKSGMAPAATTKNTRQGMIAPTPEKGTKSGLAAIGAFFGGGNKKNAAPEALVQPVEQAPPFVEKPPSAPLLPHDDEDDDGPIFSSLLDSIELPTKVEALPESIPEGIELAAEISASGSPAASGQYQNQPTSFISAAKSADVEAKPVEEQPRRSPGIAEALAAMKATEEETTGSIEEVAPEEEGDNAFARAVAEALAAEEARVQEEAEAAQARAEREAAAAARAMAEIVAAEEAKAQAARDEAARQQEAAANAAREEARLQAEAQAEIEAKAKADFEAAEAVRERTAREAEERARLEEQEERERIEREAQAAEAARVAQEAAAREAAEREAAARDAERAAAERAAEIARAEQEERERAAEIARAEQEAAAQAAAAAARDTEERRIREEQEIAARKAEEDRKAEESRAAEAAQQAAALEAQIPQIVDTPSKLSGKASQSQLAQMLNRFAKKGSAGEGDAIAPPPAVTPQMAPAAPMQIAASAAPAPELSQSQAPVDEQAQKSQKKFAELAQRLKSNAAKASEAPPVVPAADLYPAPASVAMNQQQPFSSQGDFSNSSFGSRAVAPTAPGAGMVNPYNNPDFQPSTAPDFDLPSAPGGFPDMRSTDPGKEPVQSEAFNKKIEAVKKKIEALKASGVPGAAGAAAAGAVAGAVAGAAAAAARQDYDAPKVFEDAPKQSMSASSANLGGPPVNRLLEAAQRAVETGSVSRLPAQRLDEAGRFEPPAPTAAAPSSSQSLKTSSLPEEAPAMSDSVVLAVESRRKEAAARAAGAESYSSFRDIEASIKSERTKNNRDVPDRARVRQSFNKQRVPAPLVVGGVLAIVAAVIVFSPINQMIPVLLTQAQTQINGLFHPVGQKAETSVESVDIDELIQTGKLDRARALLDKSTKANKWTVKDSERHIKMAEKYAESDPPEYEAAIEVLNKIPRKAQFYRKAQKLAKSYAQKKRAAK